MILKIYQNYIIKKFLLCVFKVSCVFFGLVVIMSLFEEISFFSEIDVGIYFPIILVLLNSFSILNQLFPFIFLIGAQFFFINFIDSNEFNAFKSYGLSNIKILKVIILTSFISGIIIVSLFYNFSAILKFKYIDLKNAHSNDSRYLASVTENGLWIKDEYDKRVYFVNADKISLNKLYNVQIIILDNNFSLIEKIFTPEINISKNEWLMTDAIIVKENGKTSKINDYVFYSNFNYQKINNLYSDLSSLTFLGLLKLRKDYQVIDYSVTDLNIHIISLYAYPFYLTVITILSSIIMINIRHQKPKIFYISGGIIFSVLIYYINFFFIALGKNEQIPIALSIWLPIFLLLILTLIGVVKLNEK
ncbi:LptF/LptG family permease [Candidatus Pelagibacter sp.]|nr:LptF/LptG family permease [Candidatus Pelagibacter sp.]